MPVAKDTKLQGESESESEYETYEYETETGSGEEESSSGEEESSSGEEESSSGEEESSSSEVGKAEGKEESSSGEYEYETEYEYESSSEPEEKEASSSDEYTYETETYESSSSSQQPAEVVKQEAAAGAAAGAAVGAAAGARAAAPAAAAGAAAAAGPATLAGPLALTALKHDSILHGEKHPEDKWAPARFVSEFIGTFAICWAVNMTRATIVDDYDSRAYETNPGIPQVGYLGVALAGAFALIAMSAAFGRVSGAHFNPAVTFAFLFTRSIDIVIGILYIVIQLAAGVLAAALTWGLLPPPIACSWLFEGTPDAVLPDNFVSPVCTYQAFGAEIFGTLFILVALYLAGVENHAHREAYVAYGAAYGFALLATLPISNGHLNPARALGAAIFANEYVWYDFWVWIIGPIIASIVAALLYPVLRDSVQRRRADYVIIAGSDLKAAIAKKTV